jgi:hypothetical protein
VSRVHFHLQFLFPFCLLLFSDRFLSAQAPFFRESRSTAVAEPLQNAFSVVTADLTGDGRPDVLIGSTGAVVLFQMGEDSHFGPGKLIPTGCTMQRLALADFDRDGTLDLAVYCFGSGQVLFYRGDGKGGFPESSRITLKATSARGMTATDLNQDGIIDLAVGQSGGVVLLFGNGDLTFRVAEPLLEISTFGGKATPVTIVSADFNADGIPDLATANPIYDDGGSVFLGTGGGKFGPEIKINPTGRPMDLVPVDVNRDGRMDLAFACQGVFVVLQGRGDGYFDLGLEIPISASPMSVGTADLNADGSADFVLGDYYGGVISVLLNKGDGTFRTADTVWSVGDVFALVLADVNGDSMPDLLAASASGDSALYAAGVGNGEFETPTYFGTYPANSFSLLTADLDSDGTDDLAVVAERRKTMTFLRRGLALTEWSWWKDYPIAVRFGDFDGDGITDLVIATLRVWTDDPGKDRGAAIQFLHGRGDGAFEWKAKTDVEKCPVFPGVSYSTVGGMLSLASGDFNGDGILDLALGNDPLRELQIYQGNGDGSFRLLKSLPLDFRHVASGDFNSDGVQDLAVGTGSYGSPSLVTLYTGNKLGNLQESERYEVCRGTYEPYRTLMSLRSGDFDGDKKLDLAVNCGTEISILPNSGNGRLQVVSAIKAPSNSYFASLMAVADFDGDGKDDLVTILATYNAGASLLLLLSDGDGKFRAPLSMPAPLGVVAMIAGNLDDDRNPDLAIVDAADGKVKILRNVFHSHGRIKRNQQAVREFRRDNPLWPAKTPSEPRLRFCNVL